MSLPFNSLAFKDTLVEGGFSDRQAAVLANGIWDLVTNTLATKDDLLALENRIDVKLAQLKADMLMWIVSLAVVQTTILGAMLKLLR
ncbi:MAG: hypothetical protein V4578_25415 [Pseudomonadota bacterium]